MSPFLKVDGEARGIFNLIPKPLLLTKKGFLYLLFYKRNIYYISDVVVLLFSTSLFNEIELNDVIMYSPYHISNISQFQNIMFTSVSHFVQSCIRAIYPIDNRVSNISTKFFLVAELLK